MDQLWGWEQAWVTQNQLKVFIQVFPIGLGSLKSI